MPAPNPLKKAVEKCNRYPAWLGNRLITFMFRHTVKLAGTASLRILGTDGKQVTFKLRNKKKIQNHIGSVHAAAMALLAESATGFVTGINLPGDKLPLMKSMNLNYVRRASGDLIAVASLTDQQIIQMQEAEKGEVNVKVQVTDENGDVPVECEMIWAWVPKGARRTSK